MRVINKFTILPNIQTASAASFCSEKLYRI